MAVFGIKEFEDPEDLADAAGINAAWQEPKTMQVTDDRIKAEQRLMGTRPEMKVARYQQLKQAFEKTSGPQDTSRSPGARSWKS